MRMLSHFMPNPPDHPRVTSNLVRLVLHPEGLKPSVVNWAEVALFTIERLSYECALYPNDPERAAVRVEVMGYPGIEALAVPQVPRSSQPVALVHLARGDDEARLFSMLTTIGTPLDVTAQELVIESFFPADDQTATLLARLAQDAEPDRGNPG